MGLPFRRQAQTQEKDNRMKQGHKRWLMVALLLPCSALTIQFAAEGVAKSPQPCRAETPVPNPWTKGNPDGWWMTRHEEIMALPNRAECQIAFVGDSITDGWDAELNGLQIWQKEFVPLGAVNLGINCDSTQHALWRILNGEVDGMTKLKVVVVELGVNNKGINGHTEADVEKGIIAVCEALKQKAPRARIILMGVFPRFYGRDNSANLNRNLAKLHDGKRIFFVNINKKLTDTEGGIVDRVGHVGEVGYQIWADAIRGTIKNLMADNVQYQAPIGVPQAKTTAPFRNRGGDGKTTKVNLCRAATPARNMQGPRWYRKHFDVFVWGNRFERRRAEVTFLGGSVTYSFPKAIWEKEYGPSKVYNLGMPNDSTEHVLWRIDNGAVDMAWSNLKLLVLEVGIENKRIRQDKAEDIAAGIAAIRDRVRTNVPQAKILLMGVFPPGPDGDKHGDVNNLIARLADGKQVFFLDINDALLKTPDALSKDGKTLTEKGYQVWVEQMRPLVGKLIANNEG
jgi:lysophospholipase L1-like esterase